MTLVKDMLDATVQPGSLDVSRLADLLESLQDAERAASACAAAMIPGHGTAEAVRADLDLADVCHATARVVARTTSLDAVTRPMLAACTAAAERSWVQCSQHAHHHAHCRLCSTASRRLADVAGTLATA